MPDGDNIRESSTSNDDELAEAFKRQARRMVASSMVNRRGWTDQQWVDDAERLMNEPDGAITSLVNGHASRLIAEVRRLRAAVAAANQRAEQAEAMVRRIQRLADIARLQAADGAMSASASALDDLFNLLDTVPRRLRALVADQPATGETVSEMDCATCRGTGLVPATGQGPDGYEPCPDCHPDYPGWPDETRRQPQDDDQPATPQDTT